MAQNVFFVLSVLRSVQRMHCKLVGVALLINICIPFMEKGAKILNISSATSLQPVPYINLKKKKKTDYEDLDA